MNSSLKAIITIMLSKKIIGGKHTPEEKLIKSKTKWLQKEEYHEFDKEYRTTINEQLILRIKKRTGKGSDWHISLNPRKLKQQYSTNLLDWWLKWNLLCSSAQKSEIFGTQKRLAFLMNHLWWNIECQEP